MIAEDIEQLLTKLQTPDPPVNLMARCLDTVTAPSEAVPTLRLNFGAIRIGAGIFALGVLLFTLQSFIRNSRTPNSNIAFAEVDTAMGFVNSISGEQIDEHFDSGGKLTSKMIVETSATIKPEQGSTRLSNVNVQTGVITPSIGAIYSNKGVIIQNFTVHPNTYSVIMFSNKTNLHRMNYGLVVLGGFIHPDFVEWSLQNLDPKSISPVTLTTSLISGQHALVLHRSAMSLDHSTRLDQSLWADPVTKRAIRLEVIRAHKNGTVDKTILENIQCNPSFPAHEFDWIIPKGASIQYDPNDQ